MNTTRRKTVSKGISPLIAAVLLVAFTMAIAGIMAAWATTFAQGKLTEATTCALALRILDLKFTNGNITVRVVNENNNANLTDIRFSILYADPVKNKENLFLKTYNADVDPLAPSEKQTVIVNVTDNLTEPTDIEVTAGNCPRTPAKGRFIDFK